MRVCRWVGRAKQEETFYMPNDRPYNGSTALVEKIEHLLGEKRLSTSAAIRLMLEKMLHDIKENHYRDMEIQEIKERQELLEKRSLGFWAYNNPRKAFTAFLILYSFAVSDIREPVVNWLMSISENVLKYLF